VKYVYGLRLVKPNHNADDTTLRTGPAEEKRLSCEVVSSSEHFWNNGAVCFREKGPVEEPDKRNNENIYVRKEL